MEAGTSRDKTLHGSLGKWVCTTPTEELFSCSQLSGYYCSYQTHRNYHGKVFYGQSNDLPEITVLRSLAISDTNPRYKDIFDKNAALINDKAYVLEEDQNFKRLPTNWYIPT